MKTDTLDILRCPYCGGRLSLVTSMYHRMEDGEIDDGILGCHCCIFPVIDGIPVLHLLPPATTAREQIEAGRPDLARRTMFNLDDPGQAERFDEVSSLPGTTYRDVVAALGPTFEGGYFLYRFSDPTYVVASAVVRSVAGSVLDRGGRAIDVCGGSGHLTRLLLALSRPAPVVADLHFSKLWLARRFTAPGCEGVCCDGNAPMPFARGTFRYAMCSDAFQYIWTKRQFVLEMLRLVDTTEGAVVVNHTHNQLAWSPSHGQPLSPQGYRDLFETIEPRLFAETRLLADIVHGEALDLGRRDPAEVLDADPALTIIASARDDVFRRHALEPPSVATGEFRINPLYVSEEDGDRVRLRLRFPSEDYEQEYEASRQYLPTEAVIDRAALAALGTARLPPGLDVLARRHVIVDLPKRYV